MGRKLIIKGGYFYTNSIDYVEPLATTLYQGLVINNSESTDYGKTYGSSHGDYYTNFVRAKIPLLLSVGESINVYITDSNGTMSTLKVGCVWSTSNIDISGETIIPNIVGNIYPSTTDNRQADGSFIITNNCSIDAYAYLVFGYAETSSTFPVAGKACYYAEMV